MSTDEAKKVDSDAHEDATDDRSDAFSGGSDDDDGMFDMFTGDLKGTERETGVSDEPKDSSWQDAQPPPYVYGSLKGTKNIRVLDIEPNEDFDAPLEAKIRLTSLSDPCKYLAISYTWRKLYEDGSHLCETLYIDEHPLKVTDSLDSSLRRVRQHWISGQLHLDSAPLTVWIDGACIDQSNHAERSLQVSLMDRIFSSCHALIIYLGGDAQSTGEYQLFSFPNFLYETDRRVYNMDLREYADPVDLRDCIQSHALSIQHFLHRPWFTRLWVAQELINGHGPHTRVIVGDFSLMGDAILSLLREVSQEQAMAPYRSAGSGTTDEQDLIAACPQPPPFFIEGRNYRSVLELMQKCDSLSCSDDKDRIYALLGAFKPGASSLKAD